MAAPRKTAWIVPAMAAAVALITGCATTGGTLSGSAERLERNAYELQRESRDDASRGAYSREAAALAEEARQFRVVLKDQRARKGDVDDAFADVSKRYHALRDEMGRTRNSREADVEFKAVTDAYLDIEREMRKHGRERDRYARD
jgi:hypothetical protein